MGLDKQASGLNKNGWGRSHLPPNGRGGNMFIIPGLISMANASEFTNKLT